MSLKTGGFKVRPAGDWKLRLKANFQRRSARGIPEQAHRLARSMRQLLTTDIGHASSRATTEHITPAGNSKAGGELPAIGTGAAHRFLEHPLTPGSDNDPRSIALPIMADLLCRVVLSFSRSELNRNDTTDRQFVELRRADVAYDEHGHTLFSKAGGSGAKDGLMGFTGSTVTVRFGSIIYTYDEKGVTIYAKAA